MASIFQNKKYSTFGVEIMLAKKRWRLYGLSTRRDAETVKTHLEELQASFQTGSIAPNTKIWLANLWKKDPDQYRRIAEMGLAEPREECGTIGELAERYFAFPVNGQVPKDRTSSGRYGASQSLLKFLAKQQPGNFWYDEKAVRKVSEMKVSQLTQDDALKYYEYIQRVYARSTWGRRIKHIKTMFDLAVSLKWIEQNPFTKFKGSSTLTRTRDFFISTELAETVLRACPDARWRLLFSFARWGGLRMPSEVTYLRWSDILWQEDKIRISIPKKTSRFDEERGNFAQRYIPLFPEIRTALEEYRKKCGKKARSDAPLFPELDGSDSSSAFLRKQFNHILKKNGIPVWPKLFNNLRATRDTELQEEYPLHKVCAWMGHTAEVSLRHYTQMREEDFHLASRPKSKNREKHREKHRDASRFKE
ncbi:MAG: site-specific integrase [Thermoguttaceae bacterium]|nr:site-specific integrase [Thermoguttaceae bacterium]